MNDIYTRAQEINNDHVSTTFHKAMAEADQARLDMLMYLRREGFAPHVPYYMTTNLGTARPIPDGSVVYDLSSMRPGYFTGGKLYHFSNMTSGELEPVDCDPRVNMEIDQEWMARYLWVDRSADTYPEAVSQ